MQDKNGKVVYFCSAKDCDHYEEVGLDDDAPEHCGLCGSVMRFKCDHCHRTQPRYDIRFTHCKKCCKPYK